MDTVLVLIMSLYSVELAKGEVIWTSNKNESVCEGEDVHLKFSYNSDEAILSKNWYFIKDSKRIPIATQVTSKFSVHGNYFSRVSPDDTGNGHIILKSVSQADQGMYLLQIDKNKSYLNWTIELKVNVPPASVPFFRDEKNAAGITTRITCNSPIRDGIPPVQMMLMDSKGIVQQSLSISINDVKYQCCMEGEAVACFTTNEKCRTFSLEGEWCGDVFKALCILIPTLMYAAVSIMSLLMARWSEKHSRANSKLRNFFNRMKARVSKQCVGLQIVGLLVVLGVSLLSCLLNRRGECPSIATHIQIGISSAGIILMIDIGNRMAARSSRKKTESYV